MLNHEKNGYVVKKKPVTVYGNTVKANVDVDLALDIREHGVNSKMWFYVAGMVIIYHLLNNYKGWVLR